MSTTITITNKSTREKITISRSACATHPEWAHAQLGTKSEAELQRHLDFCHVDDWYDEGGKHLGDDCDGMSMWRSL